MISGEQIHIAVEPAYLGQDAQGARHVFSYTITIQNRGQEPARLLTRHWIITDGNGRVEEVLGDGVVGEQPRLRPGEEHRYTSGAIIDTPFGTMQGSYGMVTDTGEKFSATIPLFRLQAPGVLH
ncbi:Co2+/Mg2+ efflux protein ApaG [Candidatus Foliamicus sp.]